jgi:hypothetical protein
MIAGFVHSSTPSVIERVQRKGYRFDGARLDAASPWAGSFTNRSPFPCEIISKSA